MDNVKTFLKKYKIFPYIAMMIVLTIMMYCVKWYGFPRGLGGNDAVYLYRYYNVIAFIFLALASVVFFGVFVKKMVIQKLFVIIGIGVGIIYMLIITPNAAADETKHMYAVTSYVNAINGKGSTQDLYTYYARACDGNTGLDESISLSNYVRVAKGFFSIADSADKETIIMESEVYNYTNSLVLFYLPGIVGVLLGHFFSLGGIPTYMLARLFMLITYICICYVALKKIPVGKNIMALVMLMPTTLARAACVSVDAVINSVIFLFIAYVFSLILKNDKIKVREAIITVIAGVIMCMGKGGAYMPLLLMLFLIPKSNFGMKIKYGVVVTSSIVLAVAAFLAANPTLLGEILSSEHEELIWTEDTGFTLYHIMSNPKETACILFNTIYIFGSKLYVEMIAGGFGWLQIDAAAVVVVMYTVILAISVLNVDGKEQCLRKKERIITAAGVILSAVMIIMSMWLFWTPINSGVVLGLQGRYFIPLLFPVLYILKNTKAIIKRDITEILIFVSFIIQIITFLDIWVKISL